MRGTGTIRRTGASASPAGTLGRIGLLQLLPFGAGGALATVAGQPEKPLCWLVAAYVPLAERLNAMARFLARVFVAFARSAQELLALRCCDCLLRLLSNLQQHRGLSSGWLAGDRSFEVRMIGKRAEIEALFAELSPFIACESARARPCLTSNDQASAADDPGTVGGRAKTAVGLMAQTGVTLSAEAAPQHGGHAAAWGG